MDMVRHRPSVRPVDCQSLTHDDAASAAQSPIVLLRPSETPLQSNPASPGSSSVDESMMTGESRRSRKA